MRGERKGLCIYRYDKALGRLWGVSDIVSNNLPNVLLVHGQPGSGVMWGELPRLLSSRANIYSYDRPGWGAASAIPQSLTGNVDYLSSVIRRFDNVPLLVGFSYGGAVVLEYASREFQTNPNYVANHIVAVAPATNSQALGYLDRILEASILDHTVTFFDKHFHLKVTSFFQKLTGGIRISSLITECKWLRSDLGKLDLACSPNDQIIILAGLLDRVVPPSSIRALSEKIPFAKVFWNPDVGHRYVSKAPGVIATAISEMLNIYGKSAGNCNNS